MRPLRLNILKTSVLQHPRLSNANCCGLESYYRLGGRNVLRPYFVAGDIVVEGRVETIKRNCSRSSFLWVSNRYNF